MKRLMPVVSLFVLSCSSSLPEVCERILECCQRLPSALVSACEESHRQATAADSGDVEAACRSVLDVIVASGTCESMDLPTEPEASAPPTPPGQAVSQPCEPSFGLDACGAGLFCAAFDGRSLPTCYAERSRQAGETCQENRHCVFSACAPSGHCQAGSGSTCTPAVGCASRNEVCDPSDRGAREQTCLPVGSGSEGARCGEDLHCDRELRCVERRCRPDGREGAPCPSSQGCDEGLRCMGGRCEAPSETSLVCRPGYEDCPAGRHCDVAGSSPGSGLACVEGGSAGLGDACSVGGCRAPYLCFPTFLLAWECVAPCRLDTRSCPEGGVCQDLSDLGLPFGICR